ncbi:MAG TPA: hypothetical protein VI911_07390 [Patescibacteria group bacterium]|nr:hypothetical protein [Patescibacteria group bacterium]
MKKEGEGVEKERKRIVGIITKRIAKIKNLYLATKLIEYMYAVIVLKDIKEKIEDIENEINKRNSRKINQRR